MGTDAEGKASFTFELPRAKRVPPGQAITAIAILNAGGETSEFSPPKVVKSAP